MSERKVVLYISMSLDGFIATKDDDLSWLSVVEKEGEDYGYIEFTKTIDTYLVGRKTYDKIVSMVGEFPQRTEYNCYVLSRNETLQGEDVTFYSGEIGQLVKKLKAQDGKNIYCDGGGEIVQLLMNDNLIDEYIISIIPVFLGDGKRLFNGSNLNTNLTLVRSKSYDTGLVQVHYKRK